MLGSYVVVFTVNEKTTIPVGAKGDIVFPIGEYGYVGSANGTGGIESRTRRHFESSQGETENKYWHIDYVLSSNLVDVASVFYSETVEECELCQALSTAYCRLFETLGASDCSCTSHILRGNVTGAVLELSLERFARASER